MTDSAAQFHLSLARVTTVQVLRANGIDRAKPSVVESLTDILVKVLLALGKQARTAAESAGRSCCELEDVRYAMEELQILNASSYDSQRETESAIAFISWCMSDEANELRCVAGEGTEELEEHKSADWLTYLIKKQIKVSGDDRFIGTSFDTSGLDNGLDTSATSHNEPRIHGLSEVLGHVPQEVRDYDNKHILE